MDTKVRLIRIEGQREGYNDMSFPTKKDPETNLLISRAGDGSVEKILINLISSFTYTANLEICVRKILT